MTKIYSVDVEFIYLFIYLFADCDSEADIFFVLDASGSIGEVNFKLIKQFTIDIVRELPIENGRVTKALMKVDLNICCKLVGVFVHFQCIVAF